MESSSINKDLKNNKRGREIELKDEIYSIKIEILMPEVRLFLRIYIISILNVVSLTL